MPRFARVVVPKFPHHITQRGNARREVFFSDADREVYLGLVQQYTGMRGVEVLGYCLMTNHVHLVLRPHVENALAKVMREVSMRYSQFRNAIERRSGHLWQSRYYSCVVEPVRLAAVMRYVEVNPVRAGMVARAEEYGWSSARAHTAAERPARGRGGCSRSAIGSNIGVRKSGRTFCDRAATERLRSGKRRMGAVRWGPRSSWRDWKSSWSVG